MVEVTLGAIANGGACVARLDGRVVFVRGGVPGERVRIEITDASKAVWWQGRVQQVIEPSKDRVTPPCPMAGVCGGCDWQHIGVARQRVLKAQIVEEQFLRLAKIELHGLVVEAVPGDHDGLGWRTRMRYMVDGGVAGLRGAASHDLAPLPPGGCRLAAPAPGVTDLAAWGDGELCVTTAKSGVTVWRPQAGVVSGEAIVTEQACGMDFQVRADGFWQVHPGAADALADAVLTALDPVEQTLAVDLYCGAGLFAGALNRAGAAVSAIDSDRAAIALARRNVPKAFIAHGRVERDPWIWQRAHPELLVLDPPRAGARREVVQRIVALQPQRVAYVACEPASLARDVAAFVAGGYELAGLRAFDIFPMTAHVECVALLVRREEGR